MCGRCVAAAQRLLHVGVSTRLARGAAAYDPSVPPCTRHGAAFFDAVGRRCIRAMSHAPCFVAARTLPLLIKVWYVLQSTRLAVMIEEASGKVAYEPATTMTSKLMGMMKK